MKPFDPRLLQAAPEARAPIVTLGAVGIAAGVAAIAQAFAIAAVVVAVVGRHSWADGLLRATIALATVLALRAVLSGVGELIASWAGTRVSTDLRARLLRTWSTRTVDERPHPSRALTLATQGAAAVEPYVARYLPTLVAAAALPVMAVTALLFVDLWSALIVVLTLPLLPLFAALIGMATGEASQRRWRTMADLSGHFLDVMRGLPTLVGYGRAERQSSVIADVSDRHRRASVDTLRLAFLSSGALELLATISVALVAVSVGIRLTWGDIALGPAMTAIMLAPEAYWPIRRVGQEFHNAADGAQALDDLLTELDDPAQGNSTTSAATVASAAVVGGATAHAADARTAYGPSGTDPQSIGTSGGRGGSTDDDDIRRATSSVDGSESSSEGADATTRRGSAARFDGVSYRYPGAESFVLQDVSLSLGSGLTALTGPSGSGKSTLLDLIAGLRRPTSGTIAAASVHLVTQRPFLIAGSLRDNLALTAPSAADAELAAALRAVGLDMVLERGLETPLGDDGFGLSAGQRARVGVARALLCDAEVIALDEPTAHLDPTSADLVHRCLLAQSAERPVVVVTHRPELVDLADAHFVVTQHGVTPHGADERTRDTHGTDRFSVDRRDGDEQDIPPAPDDGSEVPA